MPIFQLIIGFWQAYMRKLDMEILWPSCKEYSRDLDHAKVAFAMHCYHDPNWLALGEIEIAYRIDRLE